MAAMQVTLVIYSLSLFPWNGFINFPLILMGNKDPVCVQIGLCPGSWKRLRMYPGVSLYKY